MTGRAPSRCMSGSAGPLQDTFSSTPAAAVLAPPATGPCTRAGHIGNNSTPGMDTAVNTFSGKVPGIDVGSKAA